MCALFSYPNPSPLKRLSVEDGLLLNAERWQAAHAYHGHRQNIHYQSLNQPGIVCGLGVVAISAPDNIPAKYRDERWIEIQSGMAIDLLGNPIIVPQPIEFHIASDAKEAPLLVYIVIRYVDPEKLHKQKSQYLLEETFRIDEKTSAAGEFEVELCRILLFPGTVEIVAPSNVFFPKGNDLDLRYRQQAMARPQGIVGVAFVPQGLPADEIILSAFSSLLHSVTALYPALGGEEVKPSTLQTGAEAQQLDCDLLYLNYQQFTALKEAELEILKEYALSGGVLLIEFATDKTETGELIILQQKLQKALANFQEEEEFNQLRQPLQAELEATTKALDKNIERMTWLVRNVAEKLGESIIDSGSLGRHHPLRNQPFLFGQLPVINGQELKIFNWGGIILVVGNISSVWGLDIQLSLPRETIRTVQEMGINFLHFAWKRRQLMQLQL